jgi:hypothetical protein
VSKAKEIMATVRSKKDRIAVAAVLALLCTLNKTQKTVFFGAANQFVFLSPKGQQKALRDLEERGVMPPVDMAANVDAGKLKTPSPDPAVTPPTG